MVVLKVPSHKLTYLDHSQQFCQVLLARVQAQSGSGYDEMEAGKSQLIAQSIHVPLIFKHYLSVNTFSTNMESIGRGEQGLAEDKRIQVCRSRLFSAGRPL